ncbi:hypothetical protein ABZ153_35785 [Streptomyces sp. NPDC006290]|uniref:hypothetical protein n=1 Tax=Streptomyces sp. NPDC006290 TaxID=3156745 RepID=UPI0033B0AFF8
MRRRLSFLMLSGLLVALAPAVPAAADESCGETFGKHLACWSRWISEGTVHITLDRALPFDGDAESHKVSEQTLLGRRARLVVEVPRHGHTGQGGTALLLLANRTARLVANDATIDPLKPEVVDELAALGACDPKNEKDPCARLGKGHSLSGGEFVDLGLAIDLSQHTYGVDGALGGPSATSTPTETDSGKVSQGQGQGQGHGQSQGQGQATGNVGDPGPGAGAGTDSGAGSGWDTATQVLAVLCVVLVLLLGLLLFLIRRSARAVAVGTLSRRSLAAPGVGAVPAATAPRPRTRAPDEATTRLRVTPTRSHGRRVGNVPGPARPAVVRTELHPQGYVEIDHVLYRAVWAEPGRPPPAPGGLVDVTEARERDSDVLYAFPPTAGRYAKAGRP